MDIDCENRCGDRKKKGVNLMTGADLIKWIQEHNAEDMHITVVNHSDINCIFIGDGEDTREDTVYISYTLG